ncbi:hypothetical protein Hanom_Chr00s000187g01627691 [Helianthus anomalus]
MKKISKEIREITCCNWGRNLTNRKIVVEGIHDDTIYIKLEKRFAGYGLGLQCAQNRFLGQIGSVSKPVWIENWEDHNRIRSI